MSNEKTITPAEAKAWMEGREWSNGWDVIADPSCNAVEFATQYAKNKELWDKMFTYLRDTDLDTLEVSKHILVPDELWIVIQENEPKTKEDMRIEAHKNMIDLQYTFQGNEIYGVCKTGTPNVEYNPVKDVTFYDTDEEIQYTPADPGRFFLYFPGELHQPSVRGCEPPVKTRKVVGKIRYKK